MKSVKDVLVEYGVDSLKSFLLSYGYSQQKKQEKYNGRKRKERKSEKWDLLTKILINDDW